MNAKASVAPLVVVPDWPAPPGVHAFTTTRWLPGLSQPPYAAFNLGLYSGEDVALVRANRALLMRAFALPSAPRWLRQVHGDRSLRVTEEPFDGEPEADAAFTRVGGVPLAVLSADCLPILLAAEDGSEVAAIHAGWRGLAVGIIASAVRRLRTPGPRLLGWLGPAIGARSYPVGADVRARILAHDPGAAEAFASADDAHWWCDLAALARRQLVALGVTRIFGGGFDTFTDHRFYSHRRDGPATGRCATLIWREG